MATTKYRPRVGDRRFEVGWCSEIPVNEHGESDMDRAKEHVRRFESLEDARAYAREVYPSDAFGSVSIMEVEFVAYDDDHAESHPHVGFWESRGEPEHFLGDE